MWALTCTLELPVPEIFFEVFISLLSFYISRLQNLENLDSEEVSSVALRHKPLRPQKTNDENNAPVVSRNNKIRSFFMTSVDLQHSLSERHSSFWRFSDRVHKQYFHSYHHPTHSVFSCWRNQSESPLSASTLDHSMFLRLLFTSGYCTQCCCFQRR